MSGKATYQELTQLRSLESRWAVDNRSFTVTNKHTKEAR